MEKLKKKGVNGRMLQMIKNIYKETRNEVITDEGVTESFASTRGVRQGCPLSPTLFGVYLEDFDEGWEKRKQGGIVIGSTKIYGLKFADDVAMVPDSVEGLQGMLRELDRFTEKNGMEVNTKKTKVMICRKGGRRGKEERWWYKGEELEIVKEYKYLGYWFSISGKDLSHMRILSAKARRAADVTWVIMRRARINALRRRLLIMNAIAKAGGMYGVKIWGWRKRVIMERVKSRIVKMAMGVNRSTPDYIWRTEAGERSMEVEARRRAASYIVKILEMEEERWPKICLREEIRGILNGQASDWGKDLEQAWNEVGDGQIAKMIWGRKEIEQIGDKLGKGVETNAEQEIQHDRERIKRSTYWEHYKEWILEINGGMYWNDKGTDGRVKEIWAKLRVGNYIKEGEKGFKNKSRRVCQKSEETLGHVWGLRRIQEKNEL